MAGHSRSPRRNRKRPAPADFEQEAKECGALLAEAVQHLSRCVTLIQEAGEMYADARGVGQQAEAGRRVLEYVASEAAAARRVHRIAKTLHTEAQALFIQ